MVTQQTPRPDKEDLKEASKTLLEQTKLLVTLASAFLLAPAVLFKDLAGMSPWPVVEMEACFVCSVIAGHFAAGSIAGSQYDGKYNIYRDATYYSSRVQLGLYLIGMVILIWIFIGQTSVKQTVIPAIVKTDTVYSKLPDTLKVKMIEPVKKAVPAINRKRSRSVRDTCRSPIKRQRLTAK